MHAAPFRAPVCGSDVARGCRGQDLSLNTRIRKMEQLLQQAV
jgi:hypothetical protein